MKVKKNSVVFELISGFDKSEKRAFRLFASTYDMKASRILVLFDIIYDYTHALNDKTAYQEKDIAAQVKKARFSESQYTNSKNRLKVLLMDFLYDADVKSNEIEQLNRKIALAAILKKRGHPDLSKNLLMEARKTAYELDSFVAMQNLIYVEYILLASAVIPDLAEQIYTLMAEYELMANNAIEHVKTNMAVAVMARQNWENKEIPDTVPSIETLLEKIKTERSVLLRNQYYMLIFILSELQDPPEVTQGYMADQLAMLEADLRPLLRDLLAYFVAFGLYLRTIISSGDTQLFHTQVKKMQAQYHRYSKHLSADTRAYTVLNIQRYEMIFYKKAGDKARLKQAAHKAEKSYEEHGAETGMEGRIIFIRLLRNSFFYCAAYKQSLHWAINDVEYENRPVNATLSAFLIELISAYELGYDIDAMRGQVKKIKYYLQHKAPAAKPFVTLLTDAIIGLSTARNKEEKIPYIRTIRSIYHSAMDGDDAGMKDLAASSQIGVWLDHQALI